jgi:MFS family permease
VIALFATLAIQALVTMAVLTPPVVVALAAPEIGVNAHEIGVFTSLTYCAACLSAALSGGPVRRRGAIRVSQIGLLCCGVGMALIATASLPVVVLGGVLLGIGYGPMTPSSSHILIRRTPPHRRSLIFSIKQTGVPLGGALAGTLVPPLALALGWKGAVLVMAAAALAFALAAEPLRPMFDDDADPRARAERGLLEGPRLVLGAAGLRRLVLGSLAFSALQLCFGAFIVTFLTDRIGVGLVDAGLILAASQVAGMAGRVLWGWAADRWLSPRRLLCLLGLGMAACGAGVAFMSAAWPIALVVVVAMGLGAMALGWNGVFLAEVARVAPEGTTSVATGGAVALTFLGVVIGPPLFSAVVDWTGSYRIAFLAVAACAGFAGLTMGRRP